MRSMVLVVNPAAGHGRARLLTPAIERRLDAGGVRVVTTLATSAEHSATACRDAVASGVEGVVVVGGDGMAHTGLNACARTEVPLGVIPAGRGNDFCRGVGIRPGWREAVDAVVAGGVRTIDLAEVTGDLYGGGVEYVGCVVSTGFDEMVAARANTLPVDLGAPSYAYAVLAELRKFTPLRYRLVIDGEPRELDAMLVAVANSGIFGGGVRIAPDYDLTDGLLDVVIVHPVRRRTLLALFPRLMTGRPYANPALERLRARTIVVDGDGLHGSADGEPLGRPPLTIAAAPGALRVFAQGS